MPFSSKIFRDTAGVEDYKAYRQLSYQEVDIFIVVYSVVDKATLHKALSVRLVHRF